VDEEELQTISVGIEATLNSRPIIQDDDNETLTPAHFLAGGKLTTIPHGPEPIRTENLTRSFRQYQRLTDWGSLATLAKGISPTIESLP